MSLTETFKKVHVIGIGGIGVSAVARIFLRAGARVSGSDANESDVTRSLAAAGATVHVGHAAGNVPDGTDLVVRTDAVPDDNPELVEARRRGVPDMTYFQFLGRFAQDRRTVAVAGTNGKSTTSAMLGTILLRAGFDPTVIVGSKVPPFPDGNLHLGTGDLFVVEACEHRAHLLEFRPQAAIVTNIEEDHLDFYRDRQHILDTFRQFVSQVSVGGFVVLNADDREGSDALQPAARAVRFGFGEGADYRIGEVTVGDGHQRFAFSRAADRLGEIVLRVPGRFNVQNAAAAATMALELGAKFSAVSEGLESYGGIWRRFEVVGESNGAVVVSDYGHHPTAVAGTVAAAREFYPNRKIVLAFQPHHRNRTRNLFGDFVESFDGADAVILPEIYDVPGREDPADAGVSSRQLVAAVRERDAARGVSRPVEFAENLDETLERLRHELGPDRLILAMGAGDIDGVARGLIG